MKGLISIKLKNTDAKYIEIWVSSSNKKSYEALRTLNLAF